MGDGFVEISWGGGCMGGFLEVFPGYYNDKVGWDADGALNLRENDPRTATAATAETRIDTGGTTAEE